MMVTDVTAIPPNEAPSESVRIPQPEPGRVPRKQNERQEVSLTESVLNSNRVREEVLRSAEYEAQSPEQVKVELSVDKVSGQSIFRVLNTDSNEVIREIPTEESRRIRERIAQVMGLVFDREA